MYLEFYGLRAASFELTPNPQCLLMTPMHREALHTLDYGVSGRRGIILLIGEAGTGKTTLLRTRCRCSGPRTEAQLTAGYTASTPSTCRERRATSSAASAWPEGTWHGFSVAKP